MLSSLAALTPLLFFMHSLMEPSGTSVITGSRLRLRLRPKLRLRLELG